MVNAESDRHAIAQTTSALLDAVNNSSVSGALAVWADDGVLMPPHHPAIAGREALEAYFRSLFSRARLRFVFTSSVIVVAGDVAIERVTYTATMWPVGAPSSIDDQGKGLHVYARQPGGSWRLKQDIWNSDRPVEA